MATHYDVLGVRADAPPEDVRRAYLSRARELHPDRTATQSNVDAARSARRMQEVNEAWRILRDPSRRAAYDQALLSRQMASPTPPDTSGFVLDDDDDDLDRPFDAPLAQPGDVSVSIARAIPWVAVIVVLVVIFVFTAYAGNRSSGDAPNSLLDRCVVFGSGSTVRAVPCEEPNEGKVVQIVDRASLCQSGATSRSIAGDEWLCLVAVDRQGAGQG